MPTTKFHVAAAASALLIGAFTGSAMAQTYDATHPRPAEVNGRLQNQNERVDNKLSNGNMTPGQAEHIQHQDDRINNQKRRMEARDNGHLTKEDQAILNHRENGVSNEIKHQ
jgi:hypothetical protein